MNERLAPAAPYLSRETFRAMAPAADAALFALGKAVSDTGLDQHLTELVKLRVSQINGCGFCLQFHLNIARGIGVEGTKLDLIAAWRDVRVFSVREKAALAWSEHLTGMANAASPEGIYAELREQFSEAEAVHLTVAIANINAWNRIAGGLHFALPAAWPE